MAIKIHISQLLLPATLLLLLCTVTAPVSADHSFDIDPNPSPEASTSLICPDDNPLDCYPALFQPTIHFQKIRPNQSLPPGLHVRLNIQTGEKEARLNVPEEDEGAKSEAIVIIDDLPPTPETAIGIVDEQDSPLHLRLQDTPKQAKHAESYTAARPVDHANDVETLSYQAALTTIRQQWLVKGPDGIIFDSDMADAFETLTELSHSMQWGLKICRNTDFVVPLLHSIFNSGPSREPELRSAGLLLLATAVQNNQEALKALLDSEQPFREDREFVERLLSSLDRDRPWADKGDLYTNLISREVFFLSQVCAWENMAYYYMDITSYVDGGDDAFETLFQLFETSSVKESESKMKLKHRIANFVADHVELFPVTRSPSDFNVPDDGFTRRRHIGASLQRWCKALHSDVLKYGEDNSFGFLQAQQEVSRVKKAQSGDGCVFVGDDGWRTEL